MNPSFGFSPEHLLPISVAICCILLRPQGESWDEAPVLPFPLDILLGSSSSLALFHKTKAMSSSRFGLELLHPRGAVPSRAHRRLRRRQRLRGRLALWQQQLWHRRPHRLLGLLL